MKVRQDTECLIKKQNVELSYNTVRFCLALLRKKFRLLLLLYLIILQKILCIIKQCIYPNLPQPTKNIPSSTPNYTQNNAPTILTQNNAQPTQNNIQPKSCIELCFETV